MWQGVQYVTSALSLVAFIAAAVAFAAARSSKEKAHLIETANPADRPVLIQDALEFFHVDTKHLTRDKQFQVAIEQIRARSRRFAITSSVVCVLGLAFLTLAAYAIQSTIPQRSDQEQQVPAETEKDADNNSTFDNANPLHVRAIVELILCELKDLVRDDKPDDPSSWHRLLLLNGDYDVAMNLSLAVTDNGDLAVSRVGTAARSRAHPFTEPFNVSMRSIYLDWKTKESPFDCPDNVSGTLGFSASVKGGALTPTIDLAVPSGSGSGAFGGSMEFVVTRNSNAANGPYWKLTNIRNSSSVKGFSETNIDRVTFAFAPGSNAGRRLGTSTSLARPPNVAALSLLQQLLNRP